MIFQILLVSGLAVFGVWACAQWRRAPVVSLFAGLLAFLGMSLSIRPEISNHLAHFVGVGRGADLLFYCFILLAMTAILNLHLRLRAQQDMITALTRAIALSNPRYPDSARSA
jgi:small membrane protein